MGMGVWEPKGGSSTKPLEAELIGKFAGLAAGVDDSVSQEMLEQAGLAGEGRVMTLEAQAWVAAADLDSAALIALVRLFTLVEEQVAGWDAGKKSPVIPLVKMLKDRGEFDPELRKWIKSHSKNRYLPYGSAL